jgi:hypothetical protein
MTNFRVIGVAAVLFSVLAGPAMARQVIYTPGYPAEWYPAESIFCATRQAGNPHSKYCDFITWSSWRKHGAWDSTLDNACYFDPGHIPGECSFNAQGEVLFGAHP